MRFIRTIIANCLRFYREVRRRDRLFLYFLILIATLGNAGTLVTLGQHIWGDGSITLLIVWRSFATYTIAIAGTSFADCFLRPPESDRRTSLLICFGLMLFAIGAGIVVLCVSTDQAVTISISASALLAAILWFSANAQNPNLVQTDAYTTLGGEDPLTP